MKNFQVLKLKKFLKDRNIKLYLNQDLEHYHTYKISCLAKYFIEIDNEQDLISIIKFFKQNNVKYFILGNGSNVLFKEKIYQDVIVHLKDSDCDICDTNVKAFAGNLIQKVLKICENHCLSGLEWSVGIPASVGGAVFMNMGSFSYQISQFISCVYYFTGKQVRKLTHFNNKFSYRNSFFRRKEYIILSVEFTLKKIEKEVIRVNRINYLKQKISLQPLDSFSCGSVFKNHKKLYVAKLIESCGLKGLSYGGAMISKKHSNFIINKKNASSKDIITLIRMVKKIIQNKYNICILCEVVIK